MSTDRPVTLTELVGNAWRVQRITQQRLARRAVDPETGYSPAQRTINKIITGQFVQMRPELVRAVAAGVRIPAQRVAEAAAYQYTGYVAGAQTAADEPVTSTRLTRAVVESWDREEGLWEGEEELFERREAS